MHHCVLVVHSPHTIIFEFKIYHQYSRALDTQIHFGARFALRIMSPETTHAATHGPLVPPLVRTPPLLFISASVQHFAF